MLTGTAFCGSLTSCGSETASREAHNLVFRVRLSAAQVLLHPWPSGQTEHGVMSAVAGSGVQTAPCFWCASNPRSFAEGVVPFASHRKSVSAPFVARKGAHFERGFCFMTRFFPNHDKYIGREISVPTGECDCGCPKVKALPSERTELAPYIPARHPASQYALDPDGILLQYGPEAVMEHYYGQYETSQEWKRGQLDRLTGMYWLMKRSSFSCRMGRWIKSRVERFKTVANLR